MIIYIHRGHIISREFLHKLAIAIRSADTVKASQARKYRLHITGRKQCAVDLIAVHDRNTAALSLFGNNGDTSHID